jgi:glyoxylase-like metal-dependent hydrolase (beta-lactamase superfamily II)
LSQTLRLFALTCGELTGSLGNFLAGERGALRVPVPSYLIEHPRGTAVFDAGLHPDTALDAAGRLGVLAKVFQVHLAPDQNVRSRIAALGRDPDRVALLVNSHLHFDHAGGNALLPGARIVVQRREWEAARQPEAAAKNFFDPKDFDTGQDVMVVDGEHDLFGDGSVVCLPTHGHTPGHQSLRVRLASGDVVLAADACYLKRTLDRMHLPPFAHDAEAMRESLRRLGELRARGARIFYGHDPEFWRTVPQAPAEVR